jgi:hypothetical protein
VIRWLGGEAEARRAEWNRERAAKIITSLVYLLAMAGMVIVYLVVLAACRPAEPDPDALPSNVPSQRYVSDMPDPAERTEDTCRCADRDPIQPEDPRLLP